MLALELTQEWPDRALGKLVRTQMRLDANDWGDLIVEFEAPYAGDAPPQREKGIVDGLWSFEVVELFLLGSDDRYLELEFGPHGHHLPLALRGQRQRDRVLPPLTFDPWRAGGRWGARVRIPAAWRPPGLGRVNLARVCGLPDSRRFQALAPGRADRPDFHLLSDYVAVDPGSFWPPGRSGEADSADLVWTCPPGSPHGKLGP